MNTRTSTNRRLQPLLLGLLCLAGCAPDDSMDEAYLALGALREGRTVHTTPRVSIGGSGCPEGSFRTTRSRHGMHVSVSFDAYLTRVDESVPLSRRECFIAVAVPEGDTRSYAVTAVTPRATASLTPGTWARWTSVASVDGAHPPSSGDAVRTIQVNGPHDGPISVASSPQPLTWSACGIRPDIHVTTITTLQNALPFSVNALDVQSLVIRLATRACP